MTVDIMCLLAARALLSARWSAGVTITLLPGATRVVDRPCGDEQPRTAAHLSCTLILGDDLPPHSHHPHLHPSCSAPPSPLPPCRRMRTPAMVQWTWWRGTAAPATPSNYQTPFTTPLGRGLLTLSGSLLLWRTLLCGHRVASGRVHHPLVRVRPVPAVDHASTVRRRTCLLKQAL